MTAKSRVAATGEVAGEAAAQTASVDSRPASKRQASGVRARSRAPLRSTAELDEVVPAEEPQRTEPEGLLARGMTVGRKLLDLFGPRLSPDTLDNFDPDLVSLANPLIDAMEKYFRAELVGLDNIPDGPALIVGNHNAGITFLEPMILGRAWHRKTQGRDPLRFLGHDAMVSLPLVGNALIKCGVVRAGHETADKAIAAGSKVVVFPGGNYEAFRTFKDRFKVDFGGKKGFAKLALRNRVPIVPLLSVGGHETFFVLWRGEALARITGAKKYLRSESFPLFVGLPWGVGVGPIFHLPLPAKTLVEVGEPMRFDEFGPEDAEEPEVLAKVSRAVQARLQEMMDRREAERRWPVLG